MGRLLRRGDRLNALEFLCRELEDILLAAVCSRLAEVVARPGFVVHAHADGPFHVVETAFFLVLELNGDESDAYVWGSPTTLGEFHTVDVVIVMDDYIKMFYRAYSERLSSNTLGK